MTIEEYINKTLKEGGKLTFVDCVEVLKDEFDEPVNRIKACLVTHDGRDVVVQEKPDFDREIEFL